MARRPPPEGEEVEARSSAREKIGARECVLKLAAISGKCVREGRCESGTM